MRNEKIPQILGLVLCLLICIVPAGCAAIGVAAHALPPPTIPPSYDGLQEQSVGVMVWADRALRIDFGSLQLDTAASIQKKLQADKHLKTTSWPLDPRAIARFQVDHPEVEAMPITDIAPRLKGITRLIYVEIERFGTRSEETISLYRGAMMASVKVIEIKDGVGTVAYEENSIQAHYPPHVPDEGTPRGNDYSFYLGTISAFSDELAKRFVPHAEDE